MKYTPKRKGKVKSKYYITVYLIADYFQFAKLVRKYVSCYQSTKCMI